MNILQELADYATYRVEESKKKVPLEEIRRMAFEKQAAELERIAKEIKGGFGKGNDVEKQAVELERIAKEIRGGFGKSNDVEKQAVELERIAKEIRGGFGKGNDVEKQAIGTECLADEQYQNQRFQFEEALKKPGVSFICECKKASPSKGIIAEEFDYLQIAKDYEAAGADCISVLTEPKWFLGKDEYLREIAEAVHIPCIRKDFIVDEYMIYEAKVLGAKAVLLICAILPEAKIREMLLICDSLGLSALVEAHDEGEVKMALRAGARIIGVNNRNLKDFTVDTENSRRLRDLIPRDVIFVSESGIRGPEDVKLLREAGVNAVLIGEALMRAEDKKAMLAQLRGK